MRISTIFGEWVRELKYFWFRETAIEGIPLVLARSGWSKQGGFELYLKDATRGTKLWDLVCEAGRHWNIGPGNPNLCERIESGLLSYGGDTDDRTNPFEVRLGPYVDLDAADDAIGIEALRRIHATAPRRHQLGVILEGRQPDALHFRWHAIWRDGRKVGDLTNCTWSYRLANSIGFALISTECKAGDSVEVESDGQRIPGRLTRLPFINA